MLMFSKLFNLAHKRVTQYKSNQKPLILSGITPSNLPAEHLWKKVYSDDNLEQAFHWLCQQTQKASANSDVWDYRLNWAEHKCLLQQSLQTKNFSFQVMKQVDMTNDSGQRQRIDVYSVQDRLVIRALAQVLQPVLEGVISPNCTHIKGNGGLKQTVQQTQDYISTHPQAQVIKSDVKGYYTHINHLILAEQLHYLLPNEKELHTLLWQYMHRTVEFGGNYKEIQCGLPLGSSLSPLLGGLYLCPLDSLGNEDKHGFYRRYMDDWVWVFNKKQHLRKGLKAQYTVLQALQVEMHPDKTFIGKVEKGFDFLGFNCCPTGIQVSATTLSRRDKKVARLYEQGASKRRIGLYLARWLGWATLTMSSLTFGALDDSCVRVDDGSTVWVNGDL